MGYYIDTDGKTVLRYRGTRKGIKLSDGREIKNCDIVGKRLFAVPPEDNDYMRRGADGVWVYSARMIPWEHLTHKSEIFRMDTLEPPRLNDARIFCYAFRVVEFDEWVWLYDDSERTYPCCPTPHVYVEALYWNGNEDDHPDYTPDPGLLTEAQIREHPTASVPGDYPHDMPRKEAWDAAREEAQSNCQL